MEVFPQHQVTSTANRPIHWPRARRQSSSVWVWLRPNSSLSKSACGMCLPNSFHQTHGISMVKESTKAWSFRHIRRRIASDIVLFFQVDYPCRISNSPTAKVCSDAFWGFPRISWMALVSSIDCPDWALANHAQVICCQGPLLFLHPRRRGIGIWVSGYG